MLHIIWSIIIGFVVGLIARAIMPGAQHLGFIATTLLGIGGSIVGGLIARLFSKPAPGSSFHPAVSPGRSYHVDYWRTHLALYLGQNLDKVSARWTIGTVLKSSRGEGYKGQKITPSRRPRRPPVASKGT